MTPLSASAHRLFVEAPPGWGGAETGVSIKHQPRQDDDILEGFRIPSVRRGVIPNGRIVGEVGPRSDIVLGAPRVS